MRQWLLYFYRKSMLQQYAHRTIQIFGFQPMSEQMAQVIDDEVRSVIDKNYQRAEEILKDNIENQITD
jgi:ATP-dependent Zn protease